MEEGQESYNYTILTKRLVPGAIEPQRALKPVTNSLQLEISFSPEGSQQVKKRSSETAVDDVDCLNVVGNIKKCLP